MTPAMREASSIKQNKAREARRKIHKRYRAAKAGAIRRMLSFNLDLDQYTSIISGPCVYCDGYFPPVTQGSGLDRIDNTRGYEYGNVVSCCRTCNVTRMDIFSPEETRAMIQLVVTMRKNGKLSNKLIDVIGSNR